LPLQYSPYRSYLAVLLLGRLAAMDWSRWSVTMGCSIPTGCIVRLSPACAQPVARPIRWQV